MFIFSPNFISAHRQAYIQPSQSVNIFNFRPPPPHHPILTLVISLSLSDKKVCFTGNNFKIHYSYVYSYIYKINSEIHPQKRALFVSTSYCFINVFVNELFFNFWKALSRRHCPLIRGSFYFLATAGELKLRVILNLTKPKISIKMTKKGHYGAIWSN